MFRPRRSDGIGENNFHLAKGHSRRANALHALRRLDEARVAYEKALELDPNNQLVRNSLASLLALQEQKPEPS